MQEKEDFAASAPDIPPAAENTAEMDGGQGAADEPAKAKNGILHKVKGLVDAFIDYAKNSEL